MKIFQTKAVWLLSISLFLMPFVTANAFVFSFSVSCCPAPLPSGYSWELAGDTEDPPGTYGLSLTHGSSNRTSIAISAWDQNNDGYVHARYRLIQGTTVVEEQVYWGFTRDNSKNASVGVRLYPGIAPSVFASDGTYTDRVSVSWIKATNATSYRVYKHTSNSSASASLVDEVSTTNLTDIVSPNIIYYYWVKALNCAGTSSFSSVNSGYAAAAPSSPTGVAASDGTYTNRVRVTWNSTSGATGYKLWRGTTNQSASANQIGSPSAASYDDYAVVPGSLYFYWVQATNTVGASALSSSNSGYAAATYPASPSQIVATDGTYTNRINLVWTFVTNASGYEVWRGTNGASPSATRIAQVNVITNYDDYSVVNARLYFYWIKSTNIHGVGEFGSYDTGFAGAHPGVADNSRPFSVRLNQSNGFTVVGLEQSSTCTIQSAKSLDETGNNWLDVGNVVVTNFFTTASTNLISSTNQTGFFRLVGTPDTNLTQNLVAYYPLNGDADDISGNENNGIVHGTPSLAANRLGKEGAALSFDGASYIDTGIALELTNMPISVSLWINLNNRSEGRIPFGAWSPVSITWGDYLVVCNASNSLSFRTFGASSALATSPIMSTGQWIHVVSVAKSTPPYIHRMYVNTTPYDGTQEGTASSRTNLFIGAGNRLGVATTPWTGLIDDVRIYNRVLTSNDVWKLYNLIE